ncbi:MAG: leucyl aminopeptidase [Bacteroidales bacterium]|nr:leucyl aminopeptidase [Bacteroidales bacterium]MBR5781000.1 leucyl aminopeptidase [Bacteroidales bacterium]
MNTIIKTTSRNDFKAKVYILNAIEQIDNVSLSQEEINYINECYESSKGKKTIHINRFTEHLYFYIISKEEGCRRLEEARRSGASMTTRINKHNIEEVLVADVAQSNADVLYAYAEGMALANYQFNKYKSEPKDNSLKTVCFEEGFDEDMIERLNVTIEATLMARDLVNEPVNNLNAVQFADIVSARLREVGVHVEVFNKKKIETLKMGGLLAVNAGSLDEPTFTIAEWKPENHINEKPYVLVGKGVVYDTGGYNLKTGTYMADMKHDMAGAATVAAALYGIAKTKSPYHVVALIPATDNRIDGNAHVPGDIVTMFDGTTVEIVNTDAEGRMILADALSYAKKYEPAAVFDFATLTGAASVAIGPVATVAMHHNAEDAFCQLKEKGNEVYERLVEFPLWEEYEELIKSSVADIKNVGSKYGGAITAGKFLEHFVDYPWIHFDIAGTAFLDGRDSYRTQGATGVHVRLLMKYFEK